MEGGMKGVSTTVIALVGARASACLHGLEPAANVRVVHPDPERPPLERAAAAYRAAKGANVPYLVHDTDALSVVADTWVRWFDQQGPTGELELAVSQTLARWRADSIDLPDYYLVLDSDSWEATRRHWYLGVLHRAAPHRVVPAVGEPPAVEAQLDPLAPGRWWPPLDELLDGVERLVPDQV
jgi:hypothetical protein